MLEWATEHPWMTFFIIIVALDSVSHMFKRKTVYVECECGGDVVYRINDRVKATKDIKDYKEIVGYNGKVIGLKGSFYEVRFDNGYIDVIHEQYLIRE